MSEAIYLASELWVEQLLSGTTGSDFAPLSGEQFLTVKGSDVEPGVNGNEFLSVYEIAKTLSPTSSSPINIIVYPGYYGFQPDRLNLNTPYINIISSTGNIDVNFGFLGVIINVDNIKINGINFIDNGLVITGNFPGLYIKNCSGKFSGDYINHDTILSGTFKDITISEQSGDNGFVVDFLCFSGYFENIKFRIPINVPIFNTVTSDTGVTCDLSGTFINCIGGYNSFIANYLTGTFIDCISGDNGFNHLMVNIASGATFTRCVGGNNSYSPDSNLYYCRLVSGFFNTPASGGSINLCVDGNKNVIGAVAPSNGKQFLTVKGYNVDPGVNGNEFLSVYEIAKTLSPTSSSPINIIVYPGYYGFQNDLKLNTSYINIISSTGNIDVNFGYSGASVIEDHIKMMGINFTDGGLRITGNFPGLWIENCSGQIQGDGKNGNVIASGTFKNIDIINGTGFSGIFECSGFFEHIFSSTNCGLFISSIDTLSGIFKDIYSGQIFWTNFLSGTFMNCYGSSGGSFNGICSGTFNNCGDPVDAFFSTSGGTYTNCIGNFDQTVGGLFTNCIGDFGTLTDGIYINCNSGLFNVISGSKLYYCRKSPGSGTFSNPTNGGEIHLCIDGNGKTIDSSIIPQSLSLSKVGANSNPNPERFKWIVDKTISQVLLTSNCSGITVQIDSTVYTEMTLVGVTLPALIDLVILDIGIQTGYDNANAIIVF